MREEVAQNSDLSTMECNSFSRNMCRLRQVPGRKSRASRMSGAGRTNKKRPVFRRKRAVLITGSPGRTRTADRVVNSHLLYRLSYRGLYRDEILCLVPQNGLEFKRQTACSQSPQSRRARIYRGACRVSTFFSRWPAPSDAVPEVMRTFHQVTAKMVCSQRILTPIKIRMMPPAISIFFSKKWPTRRPRRMPR